MELLKELYRISSPSRKEKKMYNFICDYIGRRHPECTVEDDKRGNLYVTKGTAELYPCIVAHMDEVHDRSMRGKGYKIMQHDNIIFAYDSHARSTSGIGADDKNGIWVALKMLDEADNIKLVFFVEEEVGCGGSEACDMTFFDDCMYVIQCDRKGNSDFITDASWAELSSKEFRDDCNMGKFGYKEANGMCTDVMQLKNNGLKISTVNLSCGYYNPHTKSECTDIKDLHNCFKFVKYIVKNLTKKYPHEEEEGYRKYYRNNYGYYGYGSGYYGYGSGCSKYYGSSNGTGSVQYAGFASKQMDKVSANEMYDDILQYFCDTCDVNGDDITSSFDAWYNYKCSDGKRMSTKYSAYGYAAFCDVYSQVENYLFGHQETVKDKTDDKNESVVLKTDVDRAAEEIAEMMKKTNKED